MRRVVNAVYDATRRGSCVDFKRFRRPGRRETEGETSTELLILIVYTVRDPSVHYVYIPTFHRVRVF